MIPFTRSWERPKIETLKPGTLLYIRDSGQTVYIGILIKFTPEGQIALGPSFIIPEDIHLSPFPIDLTNRMTITASQCEIHDLSNGVSGDQIPPLQNNLYASVGRTDGPQKQAIVDFLMDNLPSTISRDLIL